MENSFKGIDIANTEKEDTFVNKKVKKLAFLENFDYKLYRKNAICSLNQVECFLTDCQKYSTYLKLYKLLKR